MSFPAFCVDNFYENPDKVLEIVNNTTYLESDGFRPGMKSVPLHISEPEFFNKFCLKLFSLFYDFNYTKVDWNVMSSFQKMDCMDPDPFSAKNMPWIHRDDKSIIAGLIYLNKNKMTNSGTSIYKLKDGCSWDSFDDNTPLSSQCRYQLFKHGKYDENAYSSKIKQNYELFEESIRFENRFNRLICYTGQEFHRAHSYYCNETRITQVFFVKKLESTSGMPLLRMSNL